MFETKSETIGAGVDVGSRDLARFDRDKRQPSPADDDWLAQRPYFALLATDLHKDSHLPQPSALLNIGRAAAVLEQSQGADLDTANNRDLAKACSGARLAGGTIRAGGQGERGQEKGKLFHWTRLWRSSPTGSSPA